MLAPLNFNIHNLADIVLQLNRNDNASFTSIRNLACSPQPGARTDARRRHVARAVMWRNLLSGWTEELQRNTVLSGKGPGIQSNCPHVLRNHRRIPILATSGGTVMATKSVKSSAKRTVQSARKSAPRPAPSKAAAKPAIKDPVGRYMHDHWGALGKDYKLDY
jgi:hypothetical protein